MNRSFSKIRHIQESNKKLERRLLNEQSTENVPTITSIIPFGEAISSDRTNIDISGSLRVINCDENSNTKNPYSQNDLRYDLDLIQQAIGDDTKIGAYYYDETKKEFVKVFEEPQRKDSLTFKLIFPKNKIPNLSDETQLAIGVFKGGKPYKYNGKNVYSLVKGYML